MRLNSVVDPLAERIRSLREAKGWTQDQLAQQAGISRASVQNMERPEWAIGRGQDPPKRRTVLRVTRVLGIDDASVSLEPFSSSGPGANGDSPLTIQVEDFKSKSELIAAVEKAWEDRQVKKAARRPKKS